MFQLTPNAKQQIKLKIAHGSKIMGYFFKIIPR